MKSDRKRSTICMISLLVVVFSFVGVTAVFSAEYIGMHRGARTLGMGGAFTAIADDFNAVYFNPAGLADMPGFALGILDPMIDFSENMKDLYDEFDEIDTDNTEEINTLMKKYVGENNHIKVAMDIHFGCRVRNAGMIVSAIGNTSTNVRIRNPVNPVAEITTINDGGALVGFGLNIAKVKGLKAGVTLKAITRKSLDQDYTAVEFTGNDIEDQMEDDMKDGTGLSFDFGAIYTFNKVFGVTDINIGLAGFNLPEMNFGDAVDGKTQINTGVAFSQQLLGFKFTEALDLYDLTDNISVDDSFEKKIHMGVEVEFPFLVTARMGLNQGYFTAGATVSFKFLKLEVATYGEEIGLIGGQKEDRRYTGQLSVGWVW